MKPLSLALLALALSAPAFAQNNRIGLSLNSLAGNRTDLEDPNLPGKYERRTLSVLPAIGYYRMLKGGTGVGLELGYSKYRDKSESTSQTGSGTGITQYSETEISSNEFYVCPSLFQVITTANRRYRFIPSLGVPVTYIPDRQQLSSWRAMSQETGEIFDHSEIESSSQRTLRIGLFGSAAAQIRVAGNLYAGLQFGAGVNYQRQQYYGETVRRDNIGRPSETRIATPANDNLMQDFTFDFQPAIMLNYFF